VPHSQSGCQGNAIATGRQQHCLFIDQLTLWRPLLPWVQPKSILCQTGLSRTPFVIFDIRALWRSQCPKVNKYKRRLNPVWYKMLYSPSLFRQPHSVHSPLGSPHPARITSSQSLPSLSSSITPSTFHSRLKTHLFHKFFPPWSPDSFRTAFADLEAVLN